MRAARGSQDILLSTAVRTGFRTVHGTAIVWWLSTLSGRASSGFTGSVNFGASQEREVLYAIFSAEGDDPSFSAVGTFDVGGAPAVPTAEDPDLLPQILYSLRSFVGRLRSYGCRL